MVLWDLARVTMSFQEVASAFPSSLGTKQGRQTQERQRWGHTHVGYL